ncbi:MAG: ATP-binding protein, partial [Actinomycetota bacterium]
GLPYRGFFEQAEDGLDGIGARCFDAVRAGGVAVSVTTGSGWTLDLPLLFESALRQRFPLGKRASDGMVSLCLAEAVSNAMIHGNLGIASGMRSTREGLAAFHRMTMDHLADPVLAARRIEICLLPDENSSFSISVSDRGKGFAMGDGEIQAVDPTEKQGRGLYLITHSARSVSLEDGGRTIVMAF